MLDSRRRAGDSDSRTPTQHSSVEVNQPLKHVDSWITEGSLYSSKAEERPLINKPKLELDLTSVLRSTINDGVEFTESVRPLPAEAPLVEETREERKARLAEEKAQKLLELQYEERRAKRIAWTKRAIAVLLIGAAMFLFFYKVYPGIMPVGSSPKYYKTSCTVSGSNVESGSVCTTSTTGGQQCVVGTRLAIQMSYVPEKKHVPKFITAFEPKDGTYTQSMKAHLANNFKTGDKLTCWVDKSDGYTAVIVTAPLFQEFWIYVSFSVSVFVLGVLLILHMLGVFSFKSLTFRWYRLLAFVGIIRNPKYDSLESFEYTHSPSVIVSLIALGSLIAFIYILLAQILVPLNTYATNGFASGPSVIQKVETESGTKCTPGKGGATNCIVGEHLKFYLSFKGPQGEKRFGNAYYPLDQTYVAVIPEYIKNLKEGDFLEHVYVGGQNLDQIIIQFYKYDPSFPNWVIAAGVSGGVFVLSILYVVGVFSVFNLPTFSWSKLLPRPKEKDDSEVPLESQKASETQKLQSLPTPVRASMLEFARMIEMDRLRVQGGAGGDGSVPNTPQKTLDGETHLRSNRRKPQDSVRDHALASKNL